MLRTIFDPEVPGDRRVRFLGGGKNRFHGQVVGSVDSQNAIAA